jgi:hypothetical protein
MKRIIAAGLVALGLAAGVAGVALFGQEKSGGASKRKVLVELYTSQGCDSCPAASDVLGRLKGLGYGPDEVVPVNFHVDYFNMPWVDPYSDEVYSRRQWSYNVVKGRDDLYFTPMMMVDGRTPLLGSKQPEALAAIKRALKVPPGIGLKLALRGDGRKTTLTAEVTGLERRALGRELLVGVAFVEDPVTTEVRAGENAGKTLVEPLTVRSFAHKFIRLEPARPKALTFPLTLPAGAVADRCRVAVFVQDRADGAVHQADALPWAAAARVP